MGKAIAIIVASAVFATIGLLSGLVAVQARTPSGEEAAFAMTGAPALGGAVLGLVIGSIAVCLGSYLQPRERKAS